MNAADYHQLLKTAAARPLTPAEQQQLEALFQQDPTLKQEWESDVLLEQSLGKLPTPALSSNFTAQVLAAAELSKPRARSFGGLALPGWVRSRWSPAFLTLLLAGLFLAENHRENALRAEVARSLTRFVDIATLLPPTPDTPGAVTELPPMPDFRLFTDFEAINHLSLTPEKVDLELLMALQ
jgi:hypothetical protein